MIYSFSPFGYEGSLITVEVDLRRGIPAVDIVGIADNDVFRLRETVRAAINNCGFKYPNERVLISLSPADLKKEGTSFDLSVALSLLLQDSFLNETWNEEDIEEINATPILVMGELELSGKVRTVKGIHAACTTALAEGFKYAIVPKGSDVPEGIEVCEVETLNEAYQALLEFGNLDFFKNKVVEKDGFSTKDNILFDDIPEENLDTFKGNEGVKFAMTVAAAGRHHMLVWGTPGSGKTSTLQHMPELMPLLTFEESCSTTRVHSMAGILKQNERYLKRRPFRTPHQTASIEGMCGGGVGCRPGEVSLAHNGILFLDEAAEFRTSVLQMLRVVFEGRTITLSRAGRCTTYPANCQVIMNTIPCPCGNYGSKDRICLCTYRAVENFWRKFSSPLLDRIGIRINANEYVGKGFTSLEEARKKIATAWKRQLDRQGKTNEDLTPSELDRFIKLKPDASGYLGEKTMTLGLSTREMSLVLKMARTIADMDDLEVVSKECIQTALELHGATPLENL